MQKNDRTRLCCKNNGAKIKGFVSKNAPGDSDTVVGNDVWFGRESVVMPGVKIGDGAIIAAYSVVAKDVEPYTLVGGNPARFIKKRFNDELTELLLKLKWWDFQGEKLANILPLLCEADLRKVADEIKKILSEM